MATNTEPTSPMPEGVLEDVIAMVRADKWEPGRAVDDDALVAWALLTLADRDMKGSLTAIHPALPAALGHAMTHVVDDDSSDDERVLVDRELIAAAKAFYPIAEDLAGDTLNELDQATHITAFTGNGDEIIWGPVVVGSNDYPAARAAADDAADAHPDPEAFVGEDDASLDEPITYPKGA